MSSVLTSRPRYFNPVIVRSMNLFFLERKGAEMFLRLRCTHTSPHRCRPNSQNIAGRHQHLRLIRFQRLGRPLRFWPPNKLPLRKPLLRQPVSLAIVREQADGCSATATEHEHTTRKGILGEFFLAQTRERIDALASIDRLNGDQDAHLRR